MIARHDLTQYETWNNLMYRVVYPENSSARHCNRIASPRYPGAEQKSEETIRLAL